MPHIANSILACCAMFLMFVISPAHKAALNARAEEAARQGLPPQQQSAHELDATDTYKIFSALMNVTGEGDKDELGILGMLDINYSLKMMDIIASCHCHVLCIVFRLQMATMFIIPNTSDLIMK